MRTITAYGKEQLAELNDVFKENMRIMESLEESINIRQLVTKKLHAVYKPTRMTFKHLPPKPPILTATWSVTN